MELSLMGLGAAKWQAQKWPGSTSRNSGRSWEHFSHAMGQRVWKQQPEGASMGDGGSPARTMRLRVAWMSGSGTGTAESWAAQYKVLLDEVRELARKLA